MKIFILKKIAFLKNLKKKNIFKNSALNFIFIKKKQKNELFYLRLNQKALYKKSIDTVYPPASLRGAQRRGNL